MTISGRKVAAEAIGTMFLLIGTTGAGIAGMALSDGNEAMTLLAVSLSAGAMLFVWISVFVRHSGAHFNPAVTLGFLVSGEIELRDAIAYVISQIVGGVTGVCLANIMFGLPLVQAGMTQRTGASIWISEATATFGLVLLIMCLVRQNRSIIAAAVACYIVACHWCTGSGAFANPAVTIARGLTDSFTGISLLSIPGFIAVQLIAGVLAVGASRILMQDID